MSGASERVNGGANGPVLYASISYHLKPLCDGRMSMGKEKDAGSVVLRFAPSFVVEAF